MTIKPHFGGNEIIALRIGVLTKQKHVKHTKISNYNNLGDHLFFCTPGSYNRELLFFLKSPHFQSTNTFHSYLEVLNLDFVNAKSSASKLMIRLCCVVDWRERETFEKRKGLYCNCPECKYYPVSVVSNVLATVGEKHLCLLKTINLVNILLLSKLHYIYFLTIFRIERVLLQYLSLHSKWIISARTIWKRDMTEPEVHDGVFVSQWYSFQSCMSSCYFFVFLIFMIGLNTCMHCIAYIHHTDSHICRKIWK